MCVPLICILIKRRYPKFTIELKQNINIIKLRLVYFYEEHI